MTRDELIANYQGFSNHRLIELANNPNGLSKEALEVLTEELSKRELNISIKAQSSPPSHIPPISEEVKAKYPDALQAFGFEKSSIIKVSIVFGLVGFFFTYISNGMRGGFLPLTTLGLLLIGFAVYVLVVSSKKAQIIVLKDAILFKPRKMSQDGKLAIVDVVKLFTTNEYVKLPKSEIKAIRKLDSLRGSHFFYFELKNGRKAEINYHASKKYLEEIRLCLEIYLLENPF